MWWSNLINFANSATPELRDIYGNYWTTAKPERFFQVARSNKELFSLRIIQKVRKNFIGRWVREDEWVESRNGPFNKRFYKEL